MSTPGPSFSAVIPAYQAQATLGAAIRSVLAQTRGDFELLVVDDGSTDGTAGVAGEFAAEDSRVTVLSQPNRGLAGARNTGIEHARAPYVAFLDSDDRWMPEFLEAMGAALDADPAAGFAYTDGWVLDDESGRIGRATTMARQHPPADPPSAPDDFLRLLVRRNFIPAETMVRAAALADVGRFNARLRAVEDYELWLRMLAHGYRAVRPPGLLLVRRISSTSMSRDELRMYEALRETMRLVVDEHPAPGDVKDLAMARIAAIDRQAAVLRGAAPLAATRLRLRRRAGRLRRRLLRRRLWHHRPPAEVARAFPELGSP